MDIIKKILAVATVVALSQACTVEPNIIEECSTECVINIQSPESNPDSKSRLNISESIKNLTIVAYGSNGRAVKKWYFEYQSSYRVTLNLNAEHRIYAIANVGDMRDSFPYLEKDIESTVEFRFSDMKEIEDGGMPMAGSEDLKVGDKKATIYLQRLFAHLKLKVDSELIDENDHSVFKNVKLNLRQANCRLLPFGKSKAEKAEDILDEISLTDYSDVVLNHNVFEIYVPENLQGNLLSDNTNEWGKNLENLPEDKAGLCSYVELEVEKYGEEDGVSASLVYRFCLGNDALSNFDVKRNYKYDLSLSLTWEGLFVKDQWNLVVNEWSDTRSLEFVDSAGVLDEVVYLRAGNVNKFGIQFLRDGENESYGNRENPDSRPFGWNLYVNNEKIAPGVCSGSIEEYGIDWSIDESNWLSINVPSDRDLIGVSIPFAVETIEGAVKKELNAVIKGTEFTISWPTGKPDYVAKKGLMIVSGIPSGESLSISNNSGLIRIEQLGPSAFQISSVKYGATVIDLESETGMARVELNIAAPILVANIDEVNLNPDGTATTFLTSYVDSKGQSISFDEDLYDELLTPTLKFDSNAGKWCSGTGSSIKIEQVEHEGSTIPYNENGGYLGEAYITSKEALSSAPKTIKVYSSNPFSRYSSISSIRYLDYADDYTMIPLPYSDAPILSELIAPKTICSGLPFVIANQNRVGMSVSAAECSYGSTDNISIACKTVGSGTTATYSGEISFLDGYSNQRHFAGELNINMYVQNVNSGGRIERCVGYIDVFQHSAIGIGALEISERQASGNTIIDVKYALATGTNTRFDPNDFPIPTRTVLKKIQDENLANVYGSTVTFNGLSRSQVFYVSAPSFTMAYSSQTLYTGRQVYMECASVPYGYGNDGLGYAVVNRLIDICPGSYGWFNRL